MEDIPASVENRVKGAIPISIATSLAIESLCGFGEYPNDKPHVEKINELWINLRTLHRNFYNAIDTYVRETAVIDSFYDYFTEEIRIIVATMLSKAPEGVLVRFYYCNYKSIAKEFPKANLKYPSTDKQKIVQANEDALISNVLKDKYFCKEFNIVEYDVKFKHSAKLTCVLTHTPLDLLNYKKFIKLWLLESHSGGIKGREEWYTKLTNGRKLTRIPFNRMTLQVFGDNGTDFRFLNKNFKDLLLELSEKDKWTPITSEERIRFSLNRLGVDEDTKTLLSLL